LADVVFVVLCLANQTGVDLQAVFDKKMDVKAKLIAELRNKLAVLADKIKPKVYDYEFLKE
jgi:NTP pyrophosphatase (non-canonical NTP hydrolase)